MGFLSGLLSVAAPIAGAALAGPLGGIMGADAAGGHSGDRDDPGVCVEVPRLQHQCPLRAGMVALHRHRSGGVVDPLHDRAGAGCAVLEVLECTGPVQADRA